MDQRGIDAYDLPKRVATYDADMEIMHPNRHKMVQVALESLPFSRDSALQALDLGIGTGYFTELFLSEYPNSRVVGVDGAEAMVSLAKARLSCRSCQVDFRVGDFRSLERLGVCSEVFDVVYSSYALHHLNREEKRALIEQVFGLLRSPGWFVNADLIIAESPQIEERIQEMRVNGIVKRAEGRDPRFQDAASTRRFLDELEQTDGDQPQTLQTDLEIMRNAGIHGASVLWLEYREAVLAGQRFT